jgi:hypothetical protein
METEGFLKALLALYQTIRRHILEHMNIYIYCCENQKSQNFHLRWCLRMSSERPYGELNLYPYRTTINVDLHEARMEV